jgi:hypothetical protein
MVVGNIVTVSKRSPWMEEMESLYRTVSEDRWPRVTLSINLQGED